eukprot:SAG31_NODE_510_length_14725_cov_2.829482_9_plen_163_part_00
MDWQIIRSAKSPGPGAYNPDSTLDSRLRGGRFSKGNPKTDVDWSIYAASQKPGPGQYQIKGLAETTPGGRLGKGKAKGSLDWVEYVSMQIPSPQVGLLPSTRSSQMGSAAHASAREAAAQTNGGCIAHRTMDLRIQNARCSAGRLAPVSRRQRWTGKSTGRR